MKVFKKVNNRLEDNNNYLIDIVTKEWFDNKINEVIREGKSDRITKYKKINIEKSFKLFNAGFFRSDNYIRSTIISREAGICFPDPKFKFLEFKRFLTDYLDTNKTFYLNSNYPENLDIENLEKLAIETDSFPTSPECYLSRLDKKFALIYICDSAQYLTPEFLSDQIFKDYKIKKVNIQVYQTDDELYPQEFISDLEKLKVGTVEIIDNTLVEQSISINIYDIKLLNSFLSKEKVDPFYNGVIKYDGSYNYDGVF